VPPNHRAEREHHGDAGGDECERPVDKPAVPAAADPRRCRQQGAAEDNHHGSLERIQRAAHRGNDAGNGQNAGHTATVFHDDLHTSTLPGRGADVLSEP
jgi:hypothetical protein